MKLTKLWNLAKGEIMKYPRLKSDPPHKLTDKNIQNIQKDFQQNITKFSATSIRNELAGKYREYRL